MNEFSCKKKPYKGIKEIIDIFDYIILSFYQPKTQNRLKDEWQRRKMKMWASIFPFFASELSYMSFYLFYSPSCLSCSLLPNFSSTVSASASGPLACSADSVLSHWSCSQNYKWLPDCLSQEGFLLSCSISNGYGQHHASKLLGMLLGSSLCLLPLATQSSLKVSSPFIRWLPNLNILFYLAFKL